MPLWDEIINENSPMASADNQQQNKMYTFSEMMKQEDRKEFILAMLNEIKIHKDCEHWPLRKSSDVPMHKRANTKVNTILSIWSFKRKHYLSDLLTKHKTWLYPHDGMQKWGIDFWETYSPVVNWITI
eukprot:11864136-Ditylum_brightwellii.AAC.1